MPIIVSVGGLVERKGFHRVLECMPRLDAELANLRYLDQNRLHVFLSAAAGFVLATQNEGWANVFLESMACGLPVVTTDVGGNREVVSRPDLGTIVPFGDADALRRAIADALIRSWDRASITDYARSNTWDSRGRDDREGIRASGERSGSANYGLHCLKSDTSTPGQLRVLSSTYASTRCRSSQS